MGEKNTPESPASFNERQPEGVYDSRSLPDLRLAINAVDDSLLELLNRRASLSLAVGELKQREGSPVFCPGREAELLNRLAGLNSGPLPEDHLRAVYREILFSSRALQGPQRVAFLGPEGTFSHLAGRAFWGSRAVFSPQDSLAGVFRAVEEGECDTGIVPLENSLEGGVGQSLDLFVRHKVHILAERCLRIRHSLLSRQRNVNGVTVVYSHPQPLAQCGAWLMRHLPRVPVLPLESTAAAALRVAGQDGAGFEEGAAAIAHAEIAETLGLHILAQGIEDAPENWTRFVCIGLTPGDRAGADKTSIIFSVADRPGSLFKVLRCFSKRGINMRKLESRPMRGESWKYVFFADLECNLYDAAYEGLLEEAGEHCLQLRVLGGYSAHREDGHR